MNNDKNNDNNIENDDDNDNNNNNNNNNNKNNNNKYQQLTKHSPREFFVGTKSNRIPSGEAHLFWTHFLLHFYRIGQDRHT